MSAYEHLEPLAAGKAKEAGLPHIEAYLLSIAISQKRIADALQFNMPTIATSLNLVSGALGSVVDTPNVYSGQSPAAIRTTGR